jgi:long-chain fatty acid transport protein
MEFVGSGHQAEGFGSRYKTSSSSMYFNPANIDLNKDVFSLSVTSWHRAHKISRAPRPTGYDVPNSVFEARIENDGRLTSLDFRPLPSSEVNFEQEMNDDSNAQFIVFSMSKPLIKETLSIGILAVMPLGSFQEQNPYFVDENAQFFDNRLHFEHLSDKFGNMLLTAGINWQVIKQVSLGAGLTLASQSDADPAVFVSDAARTESALTLSKIKVNSAFIPYFGLSADLNYFWNMSMTLHLPYQSSVTGYSRLRFWDEGSESNSQAPVKFEFVYDFMPLRLALGQRFDWSWSDYAISLSGGVLWQQWSRFVDRLGVEPNTMKDTLTPELSLSVNSGVHAGQISGRYMPSSVPEQSGRTNYVDNDQIALDVGYARVFHSDDYDLKVGVGCQTYRLIDRQHWKNKSADTPIIDELPDSVSIRSGEPISGSSGLQTNNPGFPGFNSAGYGILWGLSFGVYR